MESITRPDGTLVANKISGLINGANASLRAQYNEAERQDVLAILFENLDETSEMFGALAIGTQGILISKQRTGDGKDWVWTTAISYAGIMANVIVSGRMQTKDGRFYIDLDKGESTATRLIGDAKWFESFPNHTIEAIVGRGYVSGLPDMGLILKMDGEGKIGFNISHDGWTSTAVTLANDEGAEGYISVTSKALNLSAPDSIENDSKIRLQSGKVEVIGDLEVRKIYVQDLYATFADTIGVQGGISAMGGLATQENLYVRKGAIIDGDLTVGGKKERAVMTSEGIVGVSAYETAEPYFGDIGEAQTDENGQIRIDIDPLFAETVNTSYPYQVFLQPYCDGGFYVAERAEDYFIVKGPKSGVFGYEIKVRQKDYENQRLEKSLLNLPNCSENIAVTKPLVSVD